MTAQDVIFRRKGTRVIYPFTEANAKNPGLISMSIAEAQDEGLLGPRTDKSAENNELAQLKAQNEELRAKIEGLLEDKENAVPPPKVIKKKVTKKKVAVKTVEPVTVETEVEVEEDSDSDLKDSLSKLGIQMDD